MNNRNALWAAYTAGDPLSLDDEEQLAAAMQDVQWSDVARLDLRMDGLARAVASALSAPQEGVRFAKQWESRLQASLRDNRERLKKRRRKVALGAVLAVAGLAFAAVMYKRPRETRAPAVMPSQQITTPPPLKPRGETPRPSVVPEVHPNQPPTRRTLYQWNVEDSDDPKNLWHGQVVDGPFHEGSGKAILGAFSLSPWAGLEYTVGFHDAQNALMFPYVETVGISFDYWVGKGESNITVQVRNRTQKCSYAITLPTKVTEEWVSVTVRMSQLHPVIERCIHSDPGDAMNDLLIMGGRLGGSPIYVDNVVMFDD